MRERIRVLFVCLGNICRSPVAEGVFLHRIRARGLDPHVEVDSAGLGSWHAGELPDERARAVASKHGVPLPSRARAVDPDEFDRWHWIVCMDHQNRRGLERLGAPLERVRLLKSFSPRAIGASDEVDDPYQHGPEAFDRMFREISEAVEHMVDHLVEVHGLEAEGRAGASAASERRAATHADRDATSPTPPDGSAGSGQRAPVRSRDGHGGA